MYVGAPAGEYRSRIGDRWHDTLLAHGDALAACFDDEEAAGLVTAAVRADGVKEAIEGAYGCIELLVGSELDVATRGRRGLGRISEEPPRFASRFRRGLTGTAAAVIGSDMEGLCLAGAAGALSYDALLDDGPSAIRVRPPDRLVELWVPHFAVSLGDASGDFLTILDLVAGLLIEELVDLCGRLELYGRRPARDVEAVQRTAILLVGAGADLAMFTTSRADGRF